MRFEECDIGLFMAETCDGLMQSGQQIKGPQDLEPVTELHAAAALFHRDDGVGADARHGGEVGLCQATGNARRPHPPGERPEGILGLEGQAGANGRSSHIL